MISMDKQYQTRDGRPVRLLCVDAPFASHKVVGLIANYEYPNTWTLTGAYYKDGHTTVCDLIEVPKIIKVERWVNIVKYEDDDIVVETYGNKDDALDQAARDSPKGITVLLRAQHQVWEVSE